MPALKSVCLILGGRAFVSRADWHSGRLDLRAYTKAGKPRFRRGWLSPLYISRCLTIDSIGELHAATTQQEPKP